MNVQTSVNLLGSIAWGSGLDTGSIEFWPQNYVQANGNQPALGLGGSTSDFDFEDGFNDAFGYGYGSMQVHNWGAKQTLLAINHFGNRGLTLQLGIGNDPGAVPGGTPGLDWTHDDNAGAYSARRLYVFVRETAESLGDGPRIIVQPEPRAAHLGKTAEFSVVALGATSAQWYKDGAPIPGATGTTLSVGPLRYEDAGEYAVRLMNAEGATLSDAAALVVEPPLPGCYIIFR